MCLGAAITMRLSLYCVVGWLLLQLFMKKVLLQRHFRMRFQALKKSGLAHVVPDQGFQAAASAVTAGPPEQLQVGRLAADLHSQAATAARPAAAECLSALGDRVQIDSLATGCRQVTPPATTERWVSGASGGPATESRPAGLTAGRILATG